MQLVARQFWSIGGERIGLHEGHQLLHNLRAVGGIGDRRGNDARRLHRELHFLGLRQWTGSTGTNLPSR